LPKVTSIAADLRHGVLGASLRSGFDNISAVKANVGRNSC
jgi:hypothetical protein